MSDETKIKINELTPEQTAATTVYRDKWIRIGLDTRPCDRDKVESMIPSIYNVRNLKTPETVLWADSPYAAIDLINERFGVTREDIVNSFCFGNQDGCWLGFYEFWSDVCGLVEECKDMKPLIEFGKEAGWFVPFDEFICLVERPEEINLRDQQGKLHTIKNEFPKEAILNGVGHKDGGMAFRYSDGKGVYRLNGVSVDEELAVTPRHKLDPKQFFKIKNAEVRREFVRKVGIEQIMENGGATVIDMKDDYELIMFDIGEGELRPFLKMINPSIGVYHIEGVHPDCKTVDDAITFRNGTTVRPRIIT